MVVISTGLTMNEKIKQLADQAEDHATEEYDKWIPTSADDFSGIPNVRKIFNEKFAQLIVKDCMDIARNVGNISEPDDLALDRCYEIEQRIQDRFGVEE